MSARGLALALGLSGLLGCASTVPPETDLLRARVAAAELRVDQLESERKLLALRVATLEETLARFPRPVTGRELEARVAALEVKVLAGVDAPLEPRDPARVSAETPRITIVDRRGPAPVPAPGEVVKPLAAVDGVSFSFARGQALDLARLEGLEGPAEAARARLEALLGAGELSFRYDETREERREADGERRLLVYAEVKTPADVLSVNEALLREGLARARKGHAREAAFEKLEAEARAAKRGLFAGS